EAYLKSNIKALTGMQMAVAKSQTLEGRLERLGANVFRVLEKAGDSIAPVIMGLADSLSELAEKLVALPPDIFIAAAGLVSLMAALASLAATIGPIVWMFQHFGSSVIAIT